MSDKENVGGKSRKEVPTWAKYSMAAVAAVGMGYGSYRYGMTRGRKASLQAQGLPVERIGAK